ncbi:ADP-glyceromanno-heptose 6-epimerase [candidate division WOR-3 bacterium]|nr:ADP-glyceromanno-heptose 6-epimerase [candidate division WOR-3 bacterium]
MKGKKIILTGGAGFIGSCILSLFNSIGLENIVVVDDLGKSDKWRNLTGKYFQDYIQKEDFLKMLHERKFDGSVECVVHMGACSSTTEKDADYLMKNNYSYTKDLSLWCAGRGIRFIYASSGATYGDGSSGFGDDDENTLKLKPSNAYGFSKAAFDSFALRTGLVSKIAGLKFFNVFGPNEYHKGEMASVVYKSYISIMEKGYVELFKSNCPEYRDGEQVRDFVYVKSCQKAIFWLFERKDVCGIFNLGTGKPRTWNDLARAVFSAMGLKQDIRYVEMPENLRDRYQNYTQADNRKLVNAGFSQNFPDLEDSVDDYVKNYLSKGFAIL